jgi:chromosome segregation ATPase
MGSLHWRGAVDRACPVDRRSRRLVLGSALAIPLALGLTGSWEKASAGNAAPEQSAKLARRTARVSEDVDRFVARLERTEEALWALSQAQAKALREGYQSFTKQVKGLEEAEKAARSHIHEMKATGVKYASSWDATNAKIADPELRRASVEQRAAMTKEYEELVTNLNDIEGQIKPFMGNLHDLKAFLGVDLSPVHVRNAGDAIQKSQADAQALKQGIAPVQARLREFLNNAPR